MRILTRIYSLSDGKLRTLQNAVLEEIERRKRIVAELSVVAPEPAPVESPPIIAIRSRRLAPLSPRRRAA